MNSKDDADVCDNSGTYHVFEGQNKETFMDENDWISLETKETPAVQAKITELLSELRFIFGCSYPRIVNQAFGLPTAGAILPLHSGAFVLRPTQVNSSGGSGHWVGEPYGGEWISESEARGLDEGDRWSLGPLSYRPSREWTTLTYYLGGRDNDHLFLEEVNKARVELEIAKARGESGPQRT